jgi:hypothetical protein
MATNQAALAVPATGLEDVLPADDTVAGGDALVPVQKLPARTAKGAKVRQRKRPVESKERKRPGAKTRQAH